MANGMGIELEKHNYYDILEINETAAPFEVHRAYVRVKEAYTLACEEMGSIFSEKEARELLLMIEEAFYTLSDPVRRQKYNLYLNNIHEAELTQFPDFSPINEHNTFTNDPPEIPKVITETTPLGFFRRSAQANSSFKKRKQQAPTPEGFARTKDSIYEVNPEIEKKIKQNTIFTGKFLKEIRLYKRLTLEQVSNETKISKGYLAAVEAEDFDGLPARVFIRGFVIQMAKMLGLDEESVAQSYMSRFK